MPRSDTTSEEVEQEARERVRRKGEKKQVIRYFITCRI
jgi:hypothetical protein